jgi:hypothetical protein
MMVRLTKKLAETMDGVDVSQCAEGDVIELPRQRAELLIAEGWAEPMWSGTLRVDRRERTPTVLE